MADREDLNRIKKQQSLRRRVRSRAKLVLDRPQIEALLSFLELTVKQHGCDDSFKYTIEWAVQHHVDPRALVESLRGFDATCDCDVVRLIVPAKIF